MPNTKTKGRSARSTRTPGRGSSQRMGYSQDAGRNKLIQLIHVAKSKLRLEDEYYRALIGQVKAEAASCTVLSLRELDKLYALLKGLGFEPTSGKPKAKASPKAGPQIAPQIEPAGGWATEEQLYYIRGLWRLASRDKKEDSLDKFCCRITGIATVGWLSVPKATDLILALRDITEKAGYNPDHRPRSHRMARSARSTRTQRLGRSARAQRLGRSH